jgi:hypothetical protein
MLSFGDALIVAEMTGEPGKTPMARWYARCWEEPHEMKRRPASQRRVRRAAARVLFALATAVAVPEQRETVSASR